MIIRHRQSGWLLQTTDEKTAIAVVQTSSVFAANLGKTGLLLLLPLLRLRWGPSCVPGQLLPAPSSQHTQLLSQHPYPLVPFLGHQEQQSQYSPIFPSLSSQLCHFSPLPMPRELQVQPSLHFSPSGWQNCILTYTVEKSWVKGARCLYWSHFRLILKLCFLWVNTYEPFTLTPSRIHRQTNTHHHNIYWVARHEIRLRRLARICRL